MEVIENMPYEEYAKRPGVNATLLKLVHRKSLMHARAYLDGKYSEESAELAFGKCFHSLALEGREDFVTIPETYTNDKNEVKPWNWNANVCKAWGEEQDKTPLKAAEAEACRGMADSVFDYLGGKIRGRVEVSLFAEMKLHGSEEKVPVKCRVDLLPDAEGAPIVDLKSCQSAEPMAFMRSAYSLGYHMQAAFAVDVARLCGLNYDTFSLLAVETDAPHAACKLDFKDEALSLLRVGRIHYRDALRRLIEAEESNQWNGYGSHAAENFAPPWITKELEATA